MSDDFFRDVERMNKRLRHKEEFKAFERRELSQKSDKDLAEWQIDFEENEPQWRLAEHEWQRRLTAEQVSATMKAARGQAWFGIAAAVIGSLLTLVVQFLTR